MTEPIMCENANCPKAAAYFVLPDAGHPADGGYACLDDVGWIMAICSSTPELAKKWEVFLL